jgi:hypothetical protein
MRAGAKDRLKPGEEGYQDAYEYVFEDQIEFITSEMEKGPVT